MKTPQFSLQVFWRSILVLYTHAIMMEAVGPGQNICADYLDYTVP